MVKFVWSRVFWSGLRLPLAHATQDITLVPYCPMVKFVWSRVGKIEWPDIDIDIDIDVDLDIDIDQNLDMDMDMDIAVSIEFCNVSIESMKHMRVVSGSCCDQNLLAGQAGICPSVLHDLPLRST
jgi:hypothetical protein